MGQVREVEMHRRRINATFERAARVKGIPDTDEIHADYARFLCVLVSGWIEKAVAYLVLAYADGKCPRQVCSHLEASLKRLTNVTSDRLLVTMGTLDKGWRDELEALLTDEQSTALNSIVGLRNDIAHGGGSSLSLSGVTAYWDATQAALEHFEALLLPPHRPIAPSRRPRR